MQAPNLCVGVWAIEQLICLGLDPIPNFLIRALGNTHSIAPFTRGVHDQIPSFFVRSVLSKGSTSLTPRNE